MPGTLEEPLGQSKWAKRVQEMRPDAQGRRGAAFGKQVLLFRMKRGDIAGLGTEGCGELGRGIKRSLCGERKGEGTRGEGSEGLWPRSGGEMTVTAQDGGSGRGEKCLNC